MALTGGVAGVGLVPGLASAQSKPVITIGATSRIPAFHHLVYVAYGSRGYRKVTIHGRISGAASGDVARMYSQTFPYKKAPARVYGQRKTITSARSTGYSFSAKPSLATRYRIELFPSARATRPTATSAWKTVYVTSSGTTTGIRRCRRPICHQAIRLRTRVPHAVLRQEARKHLYVYFGDNLTRIPHRIPPYPKWLRLHAATTSRPRVIAANEYQVTVGFSFWIGNDGYAWLWTGCTKDTYSRDGFGLPGHHGCGARRIRASVRYLGSPISLLARPENLAAARH